MTVCQTCALPIFDRDLELVTDPEFLARFINGCEVIDVPRFRMDIVGWRSFVESFARQLHLERMKKSRSLVFQCIKDALGDNEDAFEPDKLIMLLRSKWNKIMEENEGEKITFGEYVERYHTWL